MRAWKPAGVAAALALLALALPSAASASFSDPSTFTGTLDCPGALAFDSGGGGRPSAVYVEDPCANSATSGPPVLYAYEPDGSALDTTFAGGSVETYDSDECFYSLTGAAVDPATGDLYVADENADALIDFSYTGSVNAQAGTPCSSAGPRLNGPLALSAGPSFSSPQGLAVYGANLYVAESAELVYTALGLGGAGATQVSLTAGDTQPIAVAIDSRDGTIFVLDADDSVYEYSAGGSFVGTFASGFGYATAIAVDPYSHVVYVADAAGGTVDSFNEETGAALLETQRRSGVDPYGLALDTTNHVLYIADDQQSAPGTPDTSGGLVESFSYTPAPSCATASISTKGGVAVSAPLSCSDQSGAPVSYSIASQPAHGTLSGLDAATGALTYTPDPGYDGSDSFTYAGTSDDGESDPTTVTVAVSGPTCAPETLQTAYQQAVAITLACSDSASAVSSYKILSGPADGTLSTVTSAGALTYTPNNLFVGVDSFTFEAVNADGVASAPATITLYVGTQLPPPVQGESANVYFSYGTVDVLLPGQTTPVPLTGGLQAPLGSVIEATGGGAGVFVTIDGQLQSANFFSGTFKLTQTGGTSAARRLGGGDSVITQTKGAQTLLELIGHRIPKVRCALHPHSFHGLFTLGQAQHLGPRTFAALALASGKKKFHEKGKPSRELWGSGHGNFTMVGNGSSASVRGTEWAIFDYPDGTLTFDYTDSVAVYDFHLKKTVVIKAGHYYFAALGNLPPCKKG